MMHTSEGDVKVFNLCVFTFFVFHSALLNNGDSTSIGTDGVMH
ncbi:hypothetical protein Hanom_Chr03g00194871 [Helianthus anomalus]